MIRIENLSKQYRLGGTVGFDRSFREMVSHFFRRSTSVEQYDKLFWALKDIDLMIEEGRSVGIVGHNGAGKSTLLKLLSRITYPTQGQIELSGSCASLLEVGNGFHPELSGLENIYLYGTIMGMSRRDIKQRLDEIIDYAGVAKFLDTPVKRYSSGMYMRLAFSVAAHVDPDILIVDEVLAVGDAQFRQKCLGKMDEVAQSGRTVVFVSHNMESVTSLCDKVAWLEQGRLMKYGDAYSIVNAYQSKTESDLEKGELKYQCAGTLGKRVTISQVEFEGVGVSLNPSIRSSHDIRLIVKGENQVELEKVVFTLSVFQGESRIANIDDTELPSKLQVGSFTLTFCIPTGVLAANQYRLAFGAQAIDLGEWLWIERFAQFSLTNPGSDLMPQERVVLQHVGQGRRAQ